MRTRKNQIATVVIVNFGTLPKWFSVWHHTAKLNRGIDFHLFQDGIEERQDSNIFYHNISVTKFNDLPLLKDERCVLKYPYKVCDFRPLIAEMFPEIVAPYQYWGWGDLDVIYGDIVSVIGDSFDKFDYISTGWHGESGPLAFLRNSESVNSLWRLIPDIKVKLNSDIAFGVDEIDFLYLLIKNVHCDMVFRECLFDLPVRWKDGRLRAIRTNKEYALYHFGGGVRGLRKTRSQMSRHSDIIVKHLQRGGAIRIGKQYRISRTYQIDYLIRRLATWFS
jgi:hypothetical protein